MTLRIKGSWCFFPGVLTMPGNAFAVNHLRLSNHPQIKYAKLIN